MRSVLTKIKQKLQRLGIHINRYIHKRKSIRKAKKGMHSPICTFTATSLQELSIVLEAAINTKHQIISVLNDTAYYVVVLMKKGKRGANKFVIEEECKKLSSIHGFTTRDPVPLSSYFPENLT